LFLDHKKVKISPKYCEPLLVVQKLNQGTSRLQLHTHTHTHTSQHVKTESCVLCNIFQKYLSCFDDVLCTYVDVKEVKKDVYERVKFWMKV
jgi:hypothetical protein